MFGQRSPCNMVWNVSGCIDGGPVPAGRSKSPGYGQLKLPHLMIVVTALNIGSRSGRTFIFGPFSQQGDRGVERLEATPAKHGIYATRSQRHPARDPQTDGGRSQDDPALPGAAG